MLCEKNKFSGKKSRKAKKKIIKKREWATTKSRKKSTCPEGDTSSKRFYRDRRIVSKQDQVSSP